MKIEATAVIMALPPKWYQFLVGVFASLGAVLYGYDLGVIAQVIASPSFKSTFNPSDNETYVLPRALRQT